MKIVIGTSPLDVRLLDDSGNPLGVAVVSFNLSLNAQSVPTATLEVELWGESGTEIIINGVGLDKKGLVLSESRGIR